MLRYLIEEEFKQIRRDSFIPRIIVAMPLTVMLVFPWAANHEVRYMKLSVVDNDRSTISQLLAGKASASGYFKLTDVSSTFPEALRSVESGEADIIPDIAPGFERDIVQGEPGRVLIAANAVNGTKGMLGTSYLSSILGDYARELREETGNLLTIMLFAAIYLLVVSGVGLVISNYSDTMQQAMFVMFFFMMILLMMSGLFTPVASMPGRAQAIAAVNPLKYFIEVMRLVYLKGSGFGQLVPQFFALCGFAAAFNIWAVASYKKSN